VCVFFYKKVKSQCIRVRYWRYIIIVGGHTGFITRIFTGLGSSRPLRNIKRNVILSGLALTLTLSLDKRVKAWPTPVEKFKTLVYSEAWDNLNEEKDGKEKLWQKNLYL